MVRNKRVAHITDGKTQNLMTANDELIDRAIEKRTRLRGRPTSRAEAKSLFDHLLRQGFPFELVAEKVKAASKADLEDDEMT